MPKLSACPVAGHRMGSFPEAIPYRGTTAGSALLVHEVNRNTTDFQPGQKAETVASLL